MFVAGVGVFAVGGVVIVVVAGVVVVVGAVVAVGVVLVVFLGRRSCLPFVFCHGQMRTMAVDFLVRVVVRFI